MANPDFTTHLKVNWPDAWLVGFQFSGGVVAIIALWMAISLAISLALSLGLTATGLNKPDATDKSRWTRSGVRLITDYGTGCQYLYRSGVLTPRLGPDGKQVCREPA